MKENKSETSLDPKRFLRKYRDSPVLTILLMIENETHSTRGNIAGLLGLTVSDLEPHLLILEEERVLHRSGEYLSIDRKLYSNSEFDLTVQRFNTKLKRNGTIDFHLKMPSLNPEVEGEKKKKMRSP